MPALPLIQDEQLADGRHGLKADPSREYVSGGPYRYSEHYLRSLPFYIDDLTADFGDDLYERMQRDPQVRGCVHVLKMAVLADGLQITPAGKEGEKEYDRAVEIADFCRRNTEGLPRPFVTGTLYDLLDALAYGNRVAEQVYEVRSQGPDKGKLCLKRLKVKPRRTTAFVVDAFTNLVGLLGLIPGTYSPVTVQTVLSDTEEPERIPNLLPRRKFVVFSFCPQDEDPRGTSLLRAAYNAWWFKMQTWGEYLKFIAKWADPSVVGITGEKAQPVQVAAADGTPAVDELGNPVLLTPEEAMVASLVELRNGTAAAFPYGSSVNPLEMKGEGAPFLSAIDLCDRQIATAIVLQTLATMEGKHQARAASETHQDVLGLVVAFVKDSLEAVVRNDVLAPLVEYNFGPEALSLVPKVSLGDTAQEDLAALVDAFAKLGFKLDPSQFPEIDARFGLPKRSEESVAQAAELQQAALEGLRAKNAAPEGEPPPGKEEGGKPGGDKPGGAEFAFDEGKVRRDEKGRFATTGGGGVGGATDPGGAGGGGDTGSSPTVSAADHQRVHGELTTLQSTVAQVTGLRSNWSGKLLLENRKGARGAKLFECDIVVRPDRVSAEERWRTHIHELLHASSTGYNARDFAANMGWEEGPVEALQRHIRSQVLTEAGVQADHEKLAAEDAAHPYNRYVVAVEQMRQAAGLDPLPFYTGLLQTPIKDRRAYALGLVKNVPADRKRAYLAAVSSGSHILGVNLDAVR